MHHGRETTIKSTAKRRAAEQLNDEPVSPDGSQRGSQSPGETREPDTRPEDAALQVEQLQVTRDLERGPSAMSGDAMGAMQRCKEGDPHFHAVAHYTALHSAA